MTAPLNGLQRVRLDTLVVQLQERRMHTKASDLQAALDLIDEWKSVISRLQAGWRPSLQDRGYWVAAGVERQWMTHAEQAVIYGAGEGTDGE